MLSPRISNWSAGRFGRPLVDRLSAIRLALSLAADERRSPARPTSARIAEPLGFHENSRHVEIDAERATDNETRDGAMASVRSACSVASASSSVRAAGTGSREPSRKQIKVRYDHSNTQHPRSWRRWTHTRGDGAFVGLASNLRGERLERRSGHGMSLNVF